MPVLVLTILLLGGAGSRSQAQDDMRKTIREATSVFSEMMNMKENRVPPELLEEARGVAIIPSVVKAGFVVGGRHGNGILLLQKDDASWSAPAFMKLTGGSFGFQAGVSSTDVVLVFRNDGSVQNLLDGKVTLGGNVGVAAGPVGRSAEATTDARLEAAIYSYSRSEGAFAGVSLEGASIRFDTESNHALYGPNTALHSILYEDSPSPSAVDRLQTLLRETVP